MFQLLLLISIVSIQSCHEHQLGQLELWDEPLIELEGQSQRLAVPFFERSPHSKRLRKFQIDPNGRDIEEYGTHLPKDKSRSKVWQKAFRRRLDAYSKRWVRYPFLPLRISPSLKAKVTGQLLQGDLVWVQSITNNWARLKSGVYVPLESLSPFPPALGGIGDGFLMEEPLN